MKELLVYFHGSYIAAQMVALPLVLYYLIFDYTKVGKDYIKRIRRVVSLLTLLLPLCLWSISALPSGSFKSIDIAAPEKTDGIVISNDASVRSEKMTLPGLIVVPAFEPISGTLSMYSEILPVLSILFGLAGGMGLLVFLFRWYRLSRLLARMAKNARRETLPGVSILHGNTIRDPFSLWFGRNWIFLPDDLSESARQTILAHELCHIRNNHTLWAAIDSLMAHIFWYNPLVHLLSKRGNLLREVECDAEVSDMLGRRHYIDLVMNFTRRRISGPVPFGGVQCWGGNVLEKRIISLLSDPKKDDSAFYGRLYKIFLVITLVSAVLVSGCVGFENQNRTVEEIEQKYAALVENYGEIQLAAFPNHLVHAFLLREDKSFYHHNGLDFTAIARAAYNNLKGGPLQGGSTITQQLAKRFLFEKAPKTISRKMKQIKAARLLEKHLSKDRILEMYLNSLYFGEGIYGIKNASQHYFGHPAQKLSAAEVSALAIMVSNPKGNSFKKHPQRARALQSHLLDKMVEAKILTQTEAKESLDSFRQGPAGRGNEIPSSRSGEF